MKPSINPKVLISALFASIGNGLAQQVRQGGRLLSVGRVRPDGRHAETRYTTPWKEILKGQINGKKECERRVRQKQAAERANARRAALSA